MALTYTFQRDMGECEFPMRWNCTPEGFQMLDRQTSKVLYCTVPCNTVKCRVIFKNSYRTERIVMQTL